ALIYFDIDYFKTFNDTYGHTAGDKCLKRVAQVLSERAQRAADVVARYGGEEFVMLLPNLTCQQALQVAERVRTEVANLSIPNEETIAKIVTISAGVAVIKESSFNADTLLKLADNALYQSKSNGRNCSLIAS